MRTLLVLAMPLAFGASRIDQCYALRGDRSPDAVAWMAQAMEDPDLRSCAAENLRIAEAVEPLRKALVSQTPETRAAVARVLGTFKRNELIDTLAAAASDENLLVASNAIAGLTAYDDPVVAPALNRLARKGGIVADLALERLAAIEPLTAIAAARELLNSSQVPDRLYALRVIADLGDASDLLKLKQIAGQDETLESRTRGFGLMSGISISRAAQTAIDSIRSRMKP